MTLTRAKVFKSGNSVALRLPKALGIREGDEFEIVVDAEGCILGRPVPTSGLTLDQLFGSFSPDFMAEGRLPFDDKPRDWSGSDAEAA